MFFIVVLCFYVIILFPLPRNRIPVRKICMTILTILTNFSSYFANFAKFAM